jgi:hypothetical protein
MADLEVGRSGYDARVFEDLPQHTAIRQDFARKVYGTLSLQLGVTALVAMPISRAGDSWLEGNMYLPALSTIGLSVFCLASICGGANMFRKYPGNIILLAGFTICESVLLGFTCAMYEVRSVVLCFAVTSFLVAVLTIFAFTTKHDFSQSGQYLRAGVLGLLAVGVLGMFFRYSILDLIYAYFGALVFAGYLVYDTQLIIGGKHHHCRFGVSSRIDHLLHCSSA